MWPSKDFSSMPLYRKQARKKPSIICLWFTEGNAKWDIVCPRLLVQGIPDIY